MGPKLARSLSCQAAEANKLEVQHDKQFMFMSSLMSRQASLLRIVSLVAHSNNPDALSGKHFEMNSFESKW